ncbi:histidinol-phosphate transaminase [Oceanobacillus alkalisoli]|uniref:histidinol-phosphate transaminase n=1 Tax=Oceanobacillus alkalisoli TaxID=2925113 RepID=UPI001EF13D5A|nr:histidinol-phosphate transaminase [Oceanobacillus alkalisoli]MCF3944591.1 histidinol-phosphate transaminase [Oceanobacillus alkalisoli]MCG5104778.1 histidinol-phosphate transaminase [Oceanobacillus alkalisoli]
MSKFWSSAVKRSDPYVPGEQITNANMIKLNTNENPYPPSPLVFDAIKNEADQSLRLYPSPTVDTLRKEIADLYELEKEHVFIGNGSDEVLAFSFMAFFEPGQAIRYPDISYSFYPVYAKLFDIPVEEIPLQDDFTLDPKDYYHSEGGVIFPNPNAPTSLYLDLTAIEDILRNNKDKVVIVDEAYVDFAEESAVDLLKKYDNLLIIQTMSKSRALAGLRLGFALGSPELIEGLVRIKDSFNSYTIDRLAIVGGVAAIKDKAYFTETKNKVIATRNWVTKELENLGFTVLPSQTNFLFVTHPEKDAALLYERLKENHVLIRYFDKSRIENFIRITIGTDEEMKRFFQVLNKIG